MVNGLKKNYFISLLMLVFVAGVFLRTYHFSDWLHFELDQSRDAKVVDLAIERGIGNLPLLGPKAAGSFLRLGPSFYYFEYLSALVFGNTASGVAILGLIFSCLSIPMFYALLRRFFEKGVSLMSTALFAVSFFLVMYSRFAWNPNNLPFFVLLGMYSLLRSVDREEPRNGWWLVGASAAIGIATQLHFVAFLALPIISGAFLIIKRPKIKFVFWISALLAIILLYSPVIINEIKTGGQNSEEFMKIFEKKSSGGEYTAIEKAARDGKENILGYFLILSGYPKGDLPRIIAPQGLDMEVICTDECKKDLPMGLLALAIFASGFFFYARNFVSEEDVRRRDFLVLLGLWFFVSLVLFFPIAFDLAPRFFLLVAPLPFIFFGFIMDFLEKRKLILVAFLLAVAVLISNAWGIRTRFEELRRSPTESFQPQSDPILKEKYRVTLQQQLEITDYMENFYRQNNFPVYVNSEAYYRRAFLYHLEQRSIPRDDFRNVGKIYQKGNYFLIYPILSNLEKRTAKYLVDFSVAETRDFGTLKVFRLNPKPESIKAVEQIFGPEKKPTSSPGVPVRCRWNEIFGKCNTDGSEDANEGAGDDE